MKLLATKSVDVSVAFVNANGHPADVQGEVSWESADTSVATVTAKAGNSKLATITAGPKAGEVEIFATADADLGEGVSEVEAVLEVIVLAKGVAIGGEITPVHAGSTPPPGVDNALPGIRPGIDNSLPENIPQPPLPGNALPGGPPDHVSGQPVPGGQPGNELPGGPPDHVSGQPTPPQPGIGGGPATPPGRPDHGLPDHAEPKNKK